MGGREVDKAGPDVTVDPHERYRRQIKLIGEQGQEKLKNSTVFIAGIGGLGGTAAIYLAAAGIGKLIIAHEGTVALPDLNRQILMDSRRIGEERVALAVENLRRINPNVIIEAYPERIRYERAKAWVESSDIVVDARYDFLERYALNKACVDWNKPMVEAAMYGFEVSITTIWPGKTACLNCIYPEQSYSWEPYGFPVLGATSGIAGAVAAIEVIKVITGIGKPYFNEMHRFDTLHFHSYTVSFKRNERCSHCGEKEGESYESVYERFARR
ncbi:Protein HesA [[Clostridium] ultunense Esp]|nr:Protein HesA [[Clostridium] ultunense Esp]